MPDLTEKQKEFCRQYLIDFNASRAALAAGYSEKTSHVIGWQNLQKLYIQDYLQELIDSRAERTEITQDRVLAELARIAFFDIRRLYNDDGTLKEITELDEDTARALASVEVSNEKTTRRDQNTTVQEYLKKLKSLDKKSALELLGKHLGMFADIIRIEDANEELSAYLHDLYTFCDESAKAQIHAFTVRRNDERNHRDYGTN